MAEDSRHKGAHVVDGVPSELRGEAGEERRRAGTLVRRKTCVAEVRLDEAIPQVRVRVDRRRPQVLLCEGR